ncbi:uncharacterized protein LOC116926095 [Daphnia magna]|uniref:uncharacterized protein LOC116926095 n=1 Tax=Daphnia magna TaxID=35525 RepID=UPI001E1BD930|nr:uncharacterized protein LOC116926095 [Daphnia magna]
MEPMNIPISHEKLLQLVDWDFSVKQIAKWFCVSRWTILRKLKQFKISRKKFSNIDDCDLMQVIANVLADKPNMGGDVYLRHHLKTNVGVFVQRWRIRKCVHEIFGSQPRAKNTIKRRRYQVRAPLSMVHLDTHHKLIRWRFVVVGAVDGFSRKIFCMKLDTNNKAKTVLKHFLTGVKELGLPSRVRTDKGKENVGVAHLMFLTRGGNRASFIRGRSVHNTRIERTWREVLRVALSPFRELFYLMEGEGILDVSNNMHIFSLHFVFRSLIEKSLDEFCAMWDSHKLRTEGLSPIQLFTLGIEELKRRSLVDGKSYTELQQFDADMQLVNTIQNHCIRGVRGVKVPDIVCPSEDTLAELRNHFPITKITFENSVETYLSFRYVLNAMSNV